MKPHNGNSTAYRDMSPFGNAPKKKVLTNEADGNTVEEVTDKREPGKGQYQDSCMACVLDGDKYPPISPYMNAGRNPRTAEETWRKVARLY